MIVESQSEPKFSLLNLDAWGAASLKHGWPLSSRVNQVSCTCKLQIKVLTLHLESFTIVSLRLEQQFQSSETQRYQDVCSLDRRIPSI